MHEAGEIIEQARRSGAEVSADLYLYIAGVTGLEAMIPSWAFEGSVERLRKRLKDPATRTRLKNEIKTGSPGWWNIVEAAGSWDNIVLASAQNKENERFQGKNRTRIAKEWGKEPADAAFDLVLQGQGGRVSALYYMMNEDDIVTALRFPWVSIGSDGGASLRPASIDGTGLGHPRSYGNFPRLIARYVREKKVLSLPDAIRRMTSWPATRMRLESRGLIKEGNWADVVVFDYDKIEDRATYEKPMLYPDGIDYVLVNGQIVAENGKHTGTRPGKVIYGPGRVAN